MLHIDDSILQKVSKPARYTGGEWNAVNKDWDTSKVHVALAFPDLYEVGMSNLAIPILYELLNGLPEVLAERVYAPWPDMEEQLRNNNISLYSLETRRPIRLFDILGFSLGYELSYTTVLNMLDLSGIPVFSRERDGSYPLIIAGGSCAINPEPLSDFIDAFFIGEAEDSLQALIEVYLDFKGDRERLLQSLAQLPGIYVPRFYSQKYDADGSLQSFEPAVSGAPPKIKRVMADQLIPVTMPVVPYIEVIHDRGAVEIQRGCTRGCRFCQAGVLYRPVRELPEETVVSTVDRLLKNCGYNTVSLVSLSTGDYSNINHLVDTLAQKYDNNGISISLPSLRLDKSSIDLIDSLPAGRKTTLTFAPEAGSERLRNSINKVIPEDSMMDTFAAAFEKNWMNLKLYFMIGLPTETLEDVRAIADLTGKICRLGKSIRGRLPGVRVSVSSFVPKPHTPCQWSAQDHEEQLSKKQSLLLHELRRSGAQLSWHDPRISLLEAALSRGDRRLGKVIYTAWKKGSRLDTWNEFFNISRWQEAFSDCGIDPSFYANRERSLDELLPWQHIDTGTGLDFLKSEYLKMQSGDVTPDCRFQSCNLCGLQKRHPSCRSKASALKKDGKFDFEAKTG
ncbi:MAG: TIGR03960 family B12-binding radical SAM protein [Dehalococcoidia bacterium]|nr:TIGR03960 family B12-binding radical SAM protein [Dehalococcoidia bacterium]